MIRSFFTDQFITNSPLHMALYSFLQYGLTIIKETFAVHIIQHLVQNKLFCISNPTIQKNSTDGCLQSIRNNRISLASSGMFFTFAQLQAMIQTDLPGTESQ